MKKSLRRRSVRLLLVVTALVAVGLTPVFTHRSRGPDAAAAATGVSQTGSLAIVTDNSSPGPGIYRLDLPSRRLTRLTRRGSDSSPVWSRDGKRIAFVRRMGQTYRVYVVNRDGSGLRPVGRVETDRASWGPGDKELAIADGRGISLVSLQGVRLRRLYTSGGGFYPAWSPDGKTILFSRPGRGILAVHPDGTGLRVVARPPQNSRKHRYLLQAPAWSPTGRRILFVQKDLSNIESGPVIRTANPDGSRQRTVARFASFSEEVPIWSPDSRWIAFAELRGQNNGVFEVPSGGGKPRLLYGGRSGTIWGQPSWTPFGR
jgi:TolB protein